MAIWLHKTGECYSLYKFIPVGKGYTNLSFSSIDKKINGPDYSKGWGIDRANTLDEKCRVIAENALDMLSNRRNLLFVNGYRFGSILDTNNSIEKYDSRGYWESDSVNNNINKQFIDRLKPANIYYADGHMDISTSNHLTITNFACSGQNNIKDPTSWKEFVIRISPNLLLLKSFENNDGSLLSSINPVDIIVNNLKCNTKGLNTTPNESGFLRRRIQGRIAGENLLTKMKIDNSTFKNPYGISVDTLDIVCHSMGYAYALGMIDVLKDKVPFGRFYIIAPENASSGGTDWNMFTEVWQYGSSENESNDKQDGVAPQVSVPDIENPTKNKVGGRVYIPNDSKIPHSFLSSHSIGNYKWIFTNLNEGRAGYVKSRK